MVTFICPQCGKERTGARRRCYPCTTSRSPEKNRATMKGRRYTDERRQRISEGKKRQIADDGKVFDLAAYMRGKPHPFAAAVGTERIVKDGRVQVRCADGKWRYRSRLVWEKVNGPIPPGRIIHHGDEDPMNDDPSNLVCLTRKQHLDVHRLLRVPTWA